MAGTALPPTQILSRDRANGRPHHRRSQRGTGALGILIWLIVAAAALTVALRLGPSYMEFMTVKSVMASVRKDPNAAGAPRSSLLSMITRRLDINGVTNVKPADFRFERAATGETDVTVRYEIRRPVAFNVDAVMKFEHTETMPSR